MRRIFYQHQFLKKIFQYVVFMNIFIFLIYGIETVFAATNGNRTKKKNRSLYNNEQINKEFTPISGKKDLVFQANEFSLSKLADKRPNQNIMNKSVFHNLEENQFYIYANGEKYRVETSIDSDLQNFILNQMNSRTTRIMAFVAMDPTTGKILAMVGHDKKDLSHNPCITSDFPAASVIKIITATAGIEKCGYDSDTLFYFSGGRYTLYKSQIYGSKSSRRYHAVAFEDAFAQSINPVFGKIGATCLKKEYLQNYANAFGFNRFINFDISIKPSFIAVSDDPFEIAEISSGYNRRTKMSPIHGALISAVVLNHGQFIEPSIVNKIIDKDEKVVYKKKPISMKQIITARAADNVKKIMYTTITSGTCRREFRGFNKNEVLSRLNIGGKTGSMGNDTHDLRYDWFVGFAEEKFGDEKLVVSVLIAHEKYLGKKASHYARLAMIEYFSKNYKNNKIRIATAKKRYRH